jgi:hypothetical protein
VGDNAIDWWVTEQGGGVMISAKDVGRVFVRGTVNDEDLILIARQEAT